MKRGNIATRPRPAPTAPAAPSTPTKGQFAAFVESATQEQLVVTYWFEAVPAAEPSPLVVQFTGRRVGVKGRLQAADQFMQNETVDVRAKGKVAVTARVRGVNPGEWAVTARVLPPPRVERKRRGRDATPALHRAAWSLLRWRLAAAPADAPVKTCLAPFAPIPGLIPFAYAALATAGIVLALVLQTLLVARARLPVGETLALSIGAVLTGVVGAKVWFVVIHRRERLMNGWCIQGLLTAVVIVLLGGSLLLHLPLGVLLDVSAPGLFFGMAVGRVGCFFAGCCCGRPTMSGWGVWSSDQRVGVRRIPTQLMECALAAGAGLATLAIVLVHGPVNGAIFAGGVAGYTLARQGILLLRAEDRKSVVGPPLTAAAAAAVLVGDLIVVALAATGHAL